MNLEYIRRKIKEQIIKNPEIENCGLVFDDDIIFPCENASNTPTDSFIILTEDFEKAICDYTGAPYCAILLLCYNHLVITSE